MPAFRFYHPIEVRYGDLDPQGHVNNARYLTYMEQGRVAYIRHLGLWDGKSFLAVGIILADAQVTFLRPVYLGQEVRVGVRVSQMRRKSISMEYRLEDVQEGTELATGMTTLVAYDYHAGRSMSIPDSWRQAISSFEGIDPS